MARLRFLVPLVALLALLVAGCGNSGEKFVGTYSVKQDLSQKGADKDKKLTPAEIRKQMEQTKIDLNLNADGSAALTMSAPPMPGAMTPQSMTIGGTWEYKDDLVLVALTPPEGGTAPPPMELVPTPDGKSLSTAGSQFGTLTFSKN